MNGATIVKPASRRVLLWSTVGIWLLCVAGASLEAQEVARPVTVAEALAWRSVGPAITSGRVVDIAVPESDKSIAYIAAASGGIWKTVNRGTTWKPIFDAQAILSIGDLAVAPSNPEVLYVGLGEANNQRSSYWGDGVWTSKDGGETWKHLGLPESHHVGRIAIDPTDENRVFVAALGHLYTENPDRGLYRTTDGGATWELVLAVNARTGVVDVVVDPTDPNRVYAATYERIRRPYHFTEGGPGSRLWRSLDGGDTFERMTKGLPEGELGRIGLDIYRKNPRILYATVENLNERETPKPTISTENEAFAQAELAEDRGGHRFGDGSAPESDGAAPAPKERVGGEVYRSEDGGDTWQRVNKDSVQGEPGYYYGQIRIDPNDDQKIWILGVQLFRSVDGGVTFKNDGARGVHVDHHALWIDPEDSLHMLLGNDGGLARSYDGAAHWDVYQNLPISQFYAVGVDRRKPYRIYGGLQDNGTWGFPSVGDSRRGIENRQFYRVNGGDGFYSLVDPEDPNIVYSESQFGNPSRFDLRTGQRTRIRPGNKKGEPPLRFNWSTPMALSPHNSRTLMIGSQKLHRSRDRGTTFEDLSPDLTTNDALKIAGNVPHCTITTISESPLRPGVIWVGTDDGHVQVTQDDGRHWRNVTAHFPPEVQGLWVSCVEASPHEPGMAVVSFTGYREDRFEPHLFLTDDYGGTWTSLGFGLQEKPINVVRAHPKAKGLLLVGTEGGVFVSEDGGGQWTRLGTSMPSVPVHDLVLHPDTGDLIAGTHGRGIFVLPLASLVELSPEARQAEATLAPVQITPLVPGGFGRGWVGVKHWRGSNPATGALFSFHLKDAPKEEELTLKVEDWTGATVAEVKTKVKAGYNEARWNLTRSSTGRGGARPVPAGSYRVQLVVAGQTLTRTFEVSAADLSTAPAAAEALDDLLPSDYR